MLDLLARRKQKVGLSQGTLTYVGAAKDFTPSVRVVTYGPEFLEEAECGPGCPAPATRPGAVTLVNVVGVHDPGVIGRVAAWFGLHDLLQEDILHTGQRPKIEEHGEGLFLVLRSADYLPGEERLVEEQISLFWSRDTLTVFQETEDDALLPLVARIRRPGTRLRRQGADYLLASILDTVVDRFFLALAMIGEQVELLEDELSDGPTQEGIQHLHALRRAVLGLRVMLLPAREVLAGLLREDLPGMREETLPYVRDVQDHLLQALDAVTALHDALAALMDLHISLAGMRMNQAMQVLTAVATVFIPLTFVSSIYGMNFEHMPELSWRFGYPAALSLMAVLGAGMFWYFLRRRWL
jgi:magnesium transporter